MSDEQEQLPASAGFVATARESIFHWGSVLLRAARIWLDEGAFSSAGALAFYTLFSLAPTVIIAVTIIGIVLGEKAASGHIAEQLEGIVGQDAAMFVQTAVARSRIQESGILPSLLGVGALLVGATTVFAQMQHSLNMIWGVTSKPSRNSLWIFLLRRLFSLTIVLSVGFVLLVSLLASVAMRAVIRFTSEYLPLAQSMTGGAEFLLHTVMAGLLFGTIFKILPDVQLNWKDIVLGAAVTALLFSMGRYGISAYLAYTATASTYGAAGSLVLMLLWVYYSSLILFFGAAFTRSLLIARGKPIIPRNTAVVVKKQLIV